MSNAAKLIEQRTSIRPKIGVVLGSGLGAFANSLTHAQRIPYNELEDLPASTAVGHSGQFVVGTLDTVDLAVMAGRFHLYEGYSAQQVVSGIRLFSELGIEQVVLTNAAGGINPKYPRGSLVLITDHINLQGVNPLVGPNPTTSKARGPRFPDMTEAYSKAMLSIAKQTAQELGIVPHEGVYAGLLGPSYETPAEIRYLRTIGADLVGMSTVAECVAANHLGMQVLGISCVTNLAAGLSGEKLDHSEVLAIGQRTAGTFLRLLSALLPRLAHE